MQEIVEKFTKPLTAEEKKTGEIKRSKGPETFTGTADELQRMFLEKRYTDFMPIILPTKDKVAEMLEGTSHDPDEVLEESGLEDDGHNPERYSLMLDWSPSEFSRLRAQYNRDNSRLNGTDNQWSLQYILSMGSHGAHLF